MLKTGNLFRNNFKRVLFNQIEKLTAETKFEVKNEIKHEITETTSNTTTIETKGKHELNLTNKSRLSNMLESEPKEKLTFAKMFRHSKFVALGDLQNKYLIGRVVDVVGDDVYIDYGGKFNCVCKRPEKNANLYQRNANVLIKLVDFEMASYFLSAAKHLTLQESNATLVGLYDSNSNKEKDERNDLLLSEINELNSEPIY